MHKSFNYFTFTCGRFTSGEGHYINRLSTDASQNIIDLLEKNGERNCNVVIKRSSSSSTPNTDTVLSSVKEQFSYNVTNRWYSSIGKVVPYAAPVVVPIIAQKIKEKFK